MRINPISEEQATAQSSGLWRNGEYDYEVRDAGEENSAAGNEMIKLELWIFNSEGGRKFVFDYLVESEKARWKMRHFASSCGLLSQYEKGDLMVADIIGRTGKCVLGTRAAKDGYEAKNTIRDYVKAEGRGSAETKTVQTSHVSASRAKAPAGDIDDEIPF